MTRLTLKERFNTPDEAKAYIASLRKCAAMCDDRRRYADEMSVVRRLERELEEWVAEMRGDQDGSV